MKESKTMKVITARISSGLYEALEDYARQKESTKSEIINKVLKQFLLAQSGSEHSSHHDNDFDDSDSYYFKPIYALNDDMRRILIMLEQLAEHMTSDKDEQEQHKYAIEVLEKGYSSEYEDVLPHIVPELPTTITDEAQDIMSMFQDLLISYKNLSADEKTSIPDINKTMLHCQGFDRQDPHEIRVSEYLKLLRQDERWQLPYDDMLKHSDDGNSHRKQLNQYRNMLKKHKSVKHRKSDYSSYLSRDEIMYITTL